MSSPVFNRATHFSVVWAVTLVVMTMLEWRALDRDPLGQEIFSPFISRSVAIAVDGPRPQPDIQFEDEPRQADGADNELQYEVEINFNGPMFLACFFIPVLLFHGIGLLINRYRNQQA